MSPDQADVHKDLASRIISAQESPYGLDELQQISRSLNTLIQEAEAEIHNFSETLQYTLYRVLFTAQVGSLSPKHAIAALDTLSGLLARCSLSKHRTLLSLCCSARVCLGAFQVFLTRSENHCSKPARRLLIVITKNLLRHSSTQEREISRKFVLQKCVAAICNRETATSIKACIQLMDHVLSKNLIDATDIIAEASNHSSPSADYRHAPGVADSHSVTLSISVIQNLCNEFTHILLIWLRYPDCAPAIARFLPHFYQSLQNSLKARSLDEDQLTSGGDVETLWCTPLRTFLADNPDLFETAVNHILPGLLNLGHQDLLNFSVSLPLADILDGNAHKHPDADIELCLAAAQGCSKQCHNNTFQESEDVSLSHTGTIFDSVNLGKALIRHATPRIRLAALSLILSCSSEVPLSVAIIGCLQQCLPYFHQESTPKIRNDFIALMQRLSRRVRVVIDTLNRGTPTAARWTKNPKFTLAKHCEFLQWYQWFLLQELIPTASYQRHVTALSVVTQLLSDTKDPDTHNSSEVDINLTDGSNSQILPLLLDEAAVRLLIDLVLNPFDDVRRLASVLLGRIISFDISPSICTRNIDTNVVDVEIALRRATELSRMTGRADHSDGVGLLHNLRFERGEGLPQSAKASRLGLLHQLLATLEADLNKEKTVFDDSITSTLVHGHLIALRYILPRHDMDHFCDILDQDNAAVMQESCIRVLACCERVWTFVRAILCFEAPEGNMIDENQVDDSDPGSKDLLSFCWRALRESSLLMSVIIDPCEKFDLTTETYEKYGKVVFQQLAELRHRGAFSVVAQTFAAWCAACSKSNRPEVRNLPKQWYNEALACIQQQSNALTRRSAGLPAILTGILAVHPGDQMFANAILDLQAIADAPVEQSENIENIRLPQVHALNCLKDIFTDSRFGPSTEDHMTWSLSIAISCLENEVWAIRNCGLMLLKALVKRLNGGADTASTRISSSHRQFSQLTYEKYPILPQLILRLLQNRTQDALDPQVLAQRVFPALEIVERFGVPGPCRDDIMRALLDHRGCSIWAVREKTAKALSLVTKPEDILKEVHTVLDAPLADHNTLHGQLLFLRLLLYRCHSDLLKDTYGHRQALSCLVSSYLTTIMDTDACPITRIAFYAIVADNVTLFTDRASMLHVVERYSEHLKSSSLHLVDTSSDLELDALSRCRSSLQKNDRMDHSGAAGVDGGGLSDAAVPAVAGSLAPTGGARVSSMTLFETDEELEAWGKQVPISQAGHVVSTNASDSLLAWTRALLLAINERSEVSTRISAVRSAKKYLHRAYEVTRSIIPKIPPLGVIMVMYDTLVDDDEEVRDEGAACVSLVCSNNSVQQQKSAANISFSPPAARAHLLQWITKYYHGATSLLIDAIWRVSGSSGSVAISHRSMVLGSPNEALTDMLTTALHLPSVPVSFKNATFQQEVVFEEEKQNLYVDLAKESEVWATVIRQMSIKCWPRDLHTGLQTWVIKAIDCFIEGFREGDGPLGLTSKPDVFALVMQVVQMYKVLVDLDRKALREENYTMMKKMLAFQNLGKQKDLHPLILQILDST